MIENLNPLANYLQQHARKLSLSALLNAHARLSMTQIKKGSVSYEDILQTLKLTLEGKTDETGAKLEADMEVYGALLYSSILAPCFSAASMNKPSLVMKADVVGNETCFIRVLLKELKDQAGGNAQNSTVLNFEKDSANYLLANGVHDAIVGEDASISGRTSRVSTPDRSIETSPSLRPLNSLPPADMETLDALPKAVENKLQSSSSQEDSELDYDSSQTEAEGTVSTETSARHEPVAQFLSQIRRYGMVILVPQTLHDQVSH
jgi:hypothetical protein